jgi:hypothetical protein
MTLSGEDWESTNWSQDLRFKFEEIVLEFYEIVQIVRDSAERSLFVDIFEPDIPLISMSLLYPLE